MTMKMIEAMMMIIPQNPNPKPCNHNLLILLILYSATMIPSKKEPTTFIIKTVQGLGIFEQSAITDLNSPPTTDPIAIATKFIS